MKKTLIFLIMTTIMSLYKTQEKYNCSEILLWFDDPLKSNTIPFGVLFPTDTENPIQELKINIDTPFFSNEYQLEYSKKYHFVFIKNIPSVPVDYNIQISDNTNKLLCNYNKKSTPLQQEGNQQEVMEINFNFLMNYTVTDIGFMSAIKFKMNTNEFFMNTTCFYKVGSSEILNQAQNLNYKISENEKHQIKEKLMFIKEFQVWNYEKANMVEDGVTKDGKYEIKYSNKIERIETIKGFNNNFLSNANFSSFVETLGKVLCDNINQTYKCVIEIENQSKSILMDQENCHEDGLKYLGMIVVVFILSFCFLFVCVIVLGILFISIFFVFLKFSSFDINYEIMNEDHVADNNHEKN
jgi:hypothetical protein